MSDKSTRWVQERFSLGIDDEMVVFKRLNSPNWYCRYYVQQEQKYYQKSLKTANRVIANDKAKEIYRQITTLINRDEKVFGIKWIDALDGYAERKEQDLQMVLSLNPGTPKR